MNTMNFNKFWISFFKMKVSLFSCIYYIFHLYNFLFFVTAKK